MSDAPANAPPDFSVSIEGGRLVISIGVAELAFVATSGPRFDIYPENCVTDPALFAEAICRELRRDKGDGETLMHLMLDRAAERAIENGCEGIVVPGDE